MERSYTWNLLRKKSSLFLALCTTKKFKAHLEDSRDHKKSCYKESSTSISIFSLTPTHHPHLQRRSSPPLVSHHHRRPYHPNRLRSHHRDAQRRPNHSQRLACCWMMRSKPVIPATLGPPPGSLTVKQSF